MNRVWVSLVACMIASSVCYADEVGECYRKAENKVQKMSCLKLEHKAVKEAYDDVLERLMNEARVMDRTQKKKMAVKTLTEANKGFDVYIKAECSYVEITSEAEESSLACQVNKMRIRTADLERRYFSEK